MFMFRKNFFLPLIALLFLLTGCGKEQSVVSNVNERDANTIVVYLESHGIPAYKVRTTTETAVGGGPTAPMYDIQVPENRLVDAMAYLNQAGLPRQMGTNLLQLFAKAGLMSSDKEETIRYQAGLASQIANMIRMMDGVLDASVQLSFPPEETLPGQQTAPQKITAAVYVKHQGVFDDPNMHLESKIKRLVSGSVTGLDINDVTVVSDRARYSEISPMMVAESVTSTPKEYVSIWSVVMSQESASRFRTIFFTLIFFAFIFAIGFGWMIWKIYPVLKRKGGLKEIFKPTPVLSKIAVEEEEQPPSK